MAFGVDRFARQGVDPSNRRNSTVFHTNIGAIPGHPGSINHRAVFYYEIVLQNRFLLADDGALRPL
jgi:hypothetical protein